MPTGLIPAHAGKTQAKPSIASSRRAHPRSRGENWPASGMTRNGVGSSPLTRGKHTVRIPSTCRAGLIPAHAGKTRPRRGSARLARAHPRSRGENETFTDAASAQRGSSPLTRGKPTDTGDEWDRAGLIPAHAGKTLFDKTHVTSRRAHPRSRGENKPEDVRYPPEMGSSPLTRGKLASPACARTGHGLIPAHAGKTIGKNGSHSSRAAHPRSRGENE